MQYDLQHSSSLVKKGLEVRMSRLLQKISILALALAAVQGQGSVLTLKDDVSGLRLSVDSENTLPALRLLLPGQPDSDPGIFIVFPEHVTVRERGKSNAEHLYLFRPGRQEASPAWQRNGQALEYQSDFVPGVHLLARATLEHDGVRYRYEFENRSKLDYEMVLAITDPRMISPYFHDVRLERTYVHHKDGFDLLASETPERITEPLEKWIPNRYRVSYSWPVASQRVAKQDDGITWYNKSRAVDEPFIATKSTDGNWIMATFSYDPGNVWVNPELTCQHADPQIALQPGKKASYEVKTLLFKGTLDEALAKVREQRAAMKP
jgi:hypothetical protein